MWNLEDPSTCAPISEELIALAQRELNVRLPDAYLQALQIKNGGSLDGELFRVTSQPIAPALHGYIDNGYISVNEIQGIDRKASSILSTPSLLREWDLPGNLVLLDGDGHTWIAFDYRQTPDNPPVIFIESETCLSFHLANDFETFFNGLVPYEQLYDDDGQFIGD